MLVFMSSLQPVISEKDIEDNLREVTYATTPIMSTYLVAFVVGEYDYIEARDTDEVLIRVYTPLGKKEQGRFALDVSWHVLQETKVEENYCQFGGKWEQEKKLGVSLGDRKI